MKKTFFVLWFSLSIAVSTQAKISTEYQSLIKQIDVLAKDQKMQEALDTLNSQSKFITDPVDRARILVKATQLETSLHGYETAVQNLKKQVWPKNVKAQFLLSLFYAHTLRNYARSYSWEINQREKTNSGHNKDLKTWTVQEIFGEAIKSLNSAWEIRQQLGSLNKETLSDFISPNNYPDNIRDSLRDALAYQFVQILNDSSGWTPQQANEYYELNLPMLLKGERVALLSLETHPIQKIAFILEDLRSWDETKQNIEGAIEAKLTLFRILHARFTQDQDRTFLKDELTKLADQSENNSWYSMAAATLAEFWQDDSSPNSLVIAHRIAAKGAAFNVKSVGAAKCRNIITQIEQASVEMQAMKIDGKQKKSIGIQYKNIQKLYFRSYFYDVKEFALRSKDYSRFPSWNQFRELLSKKPEYEWASKLETTTDYKNHMHYVTPPEHKNGFYIIVVSIDPSFRAKNNILKGVMSTFGPLILATKNIYYNGSFEVEAFDGETGVLLPGVKVAIYKKDYSSVPVFVKSETTDKYGKILFSDLGALKPQYFLIAEYKDATAVLDFYMNAVPAVEKPQLRALIYSDRSIYRPLQKIKWKAIYYRSDPTPGKFTIANALETKVILYDMNGQEVQKLSVKTDDFGAAWGEFTVPSGSTLGSWRISTEQGSHNLQVEEYKRPSFELTWAEQKTPMRLNHAAEVVGEAKYYFGTPLSNGKVNFKVEKQLVLPWWCVWGSLDFSGIQKSQIVQTGSSQIDNDGHFKINFTPKADEQMISKIEGLKYRFVISADVTDEGGETRTIQKDVAVSKAAIEAQFIFASNFQIENQAAKINLKRLLTAGGPAPGTGRWELYSLLEPLNVSMPAEIKLASFKSLRPDKGLEFEGDRLQPRWLPSYSWAAQIRDWKQKQLVQKSDVTTDDKGEASIELAGLKAGTYRLLYFTKDSFGTEVQSQNEFFVVDSHYTPRLPAVFMISKTSAKINENIFLWLPSALKNQTLIFEVFQDQKLIEHRYLKSNSESALIEWPVKEEHRGGLTFSLRLLNDYQSLQFSQNLFVPWDNKEISIEAKSFRNRLQPGQKEKWTFHLTGPKGAPIQKASAQLLAYMYDRSLDALSPHLSPSLLSIYPSRIGNQAANFDLGPAPPAYFDSNLSREFESILLRDDNVNFYSNYGIGGPGTRGGGGVMMRAIKGESFEVASSPMAAANLQENKVANKDLAPNEANDSLAKAAKFQPKSTDTASETNPKIRSNFSETAFFFPRLLNGENGSVDIDFEVPDSVTSWTLWLQALTKDLNSGTKSFQIESIKDLIVRPYLPRFLREGDKAQIKIVVNNVSDKILKGTLDATLLDLSQLNDISSKFNLSKNKNIAFTIEPKKSFNFSVEMTVPAEPGLVNFKVIAKTKTVSDGELRPLPILPGRFHLMQSRFVTLKNKDQGQMTFPDLLKKTDSSLINEKFVVQIDAQLFYSVLSAIPYLVNYPYDCIEQNLDRFVATGIVTSIFKKFPAVEKMAQNLSKRKTKLESFDENDPNRKMVLEETPWLSLSKGSAEKENELSNILDANIAKQTREESLKKLQKAQTALGGFPWFVGGPPSPYITLYIVYGFSKALEFGVEVPKPMIQKAWEYLHQHYITEIVANCIARDSCWENVTFLNYILSNYPDENWGQNVFTESDRTKMLAFSFKHWREHSPYLKGFLSLTLHRAKRTKDAQLVWDSVMDSAKYSQDEGTHWAREERSWLWYNDTIESHAFALRTLLELGSDNVKRDGLVQWIFLNKKLNHWKSTRATSEVIYSLAQYLTKTQQLGKREAVNIKVGDQKQIQLEFLPDKYTGKKNQIVYDGNLVDQKLLPVTVQKETSGLMFASATWQFSTEKLPSKVEGDFLNIDRKFLLRQSVGTEMRLTPLTQGQKIRVGDEIEVHISLKTKHSVDYVHLRDPRGAGFEPTSVTSQHKWDLGIYWYEEIRDSGTSFFFEHLPQGEYNFKYRIRATTAGDFKVSPATVQPMYAPEFAAYSSGERIEILEAKP